MTKNKEVQNEKKDDVDNAWIERLLGSGSDSGGHSLQIEEALIHCLSGGGG